jgi:hypothetical protein
MKSPALAFLGARSSVSLLALLVPGLLFIGCVSLDKPTAVKACANSPRGCSDDPVPLGKDAALAADAAPSPDLPSANDTRVAQDDLPPTVPDVFVKADLAPDLPADKVGPADVADGSVGSDGQDATAVDTREVFSPDLPGPDLPGPDLPGPDFPGPDLRGPDVPGPDLPRPDLPGPDLPTDPPTGRDSPPDIVPDLGSDQVKNDTGPGNCITQIIAAGYTAGTAPPCSACVENGNSLATKCTGMLDCLAPPKTSANFTDCLNFVGGSSPVGSCVTALTTAGCPSGY